MSNLYLVLALIGTFGAIVNPDSGVVTYEGSWRDTPATQADIHNGGLLDNGSVAQVLTLTSTGAAGSFAIGAFPNGGDGGFYVNVHTTASSNGEIRGQLTTKP